MSVFKDFWNFVQGKLLGKETIEISSEDFRKLESAKLHELELCEFALNAGINIIANSLSACEFRTFHKWEEVRKDQYYHWNYQPNVNQTANEFIHKLVWKLIYQNECLVIQTVRGDFVIADSYTHDSYGMLEDRFSNIIVGQDAPAGVFHPLTLDKTYLMSDVLFYRLNNRNITELLQEIITGYNNLLDAAIKKFYKSGGERGILTVDGNATTNLYGKKEDGTPRTFNDVYNEIINQNFRQYFESNNAVLPLFSGFSYDIKSAEQTKKSTSEVKDVSDLTDEIFEKVANALQIPVKLLRGDVANVSDLTKNLVAFGIRPIANLIQTENNRKLYGQKVLRGSYQLIDTNSILYSDISNMADAMAKMIGSSLWSIDEARARIGEAPLNTEWSSKHWMTKNNTEITMIGLGEEGGEE